MFDDTILVTGGAGFIGSAMIRYLIRETNAKVVNLDALTYAANLANLNEIDDDPRYRFEQVDICAADDVNGVFERYRPTALVHFAAESHVDRSIDDPLLFVRTNVLGTATLLQVATRYWQALSPRERARFRFHHVSTDEVFGSLGAVGMFTETSPYQPNSPYAASKAGADHLVRAWHKTYGLPAVISNCSNNFGPYQFPEKFIPLLILKARDGEPLPVYGRGENIRDWLYVEDHARALSLVLREGQIGDCYGIGAENELRNIELAQMICDLLDEMIGPLPGGRPRRSLITFVSDRPGHDARYAIDASRARTELKWSPQHPFDMALRKTVAWYLANESWWGPLRSTATKRLGLVG
jgi:dTDP-glucose 4,6-dehydratase